jgi:hypothetical protein
MTRILPEVTYTCYVCATTFTVHNRLDPEAQGRTIVSTPNACPKCTAPVKTRLPIDVGAAKGLILTIYGASYYRKAFGTAERFLFDHALVPADVDRILELVRGLDYDAWARLDAKLAADSGLSREDREEHLIRAKAQEEARSSRLMAKLSAVAETVKARLLAEYNRYMDIYERNCGCG